MVYFFFIPLIYLINMFFEKKGYLVNNTGQSHQTFSEKKRVPLTGGIFILIFFIFYFSNELIFVFSLIILFIIGILTDLDFIKSPTKRFIIQILYLASFIIFFDLKISDLRNDYLNFLLSNFYFNLFFVLFCFLVLVNGSNFIDGNNGLSIGYYLIIFTILILLINNNIVNYNYDLVINFTIFLVILFFFNLFNFFYLGDNGIYLISIFAGYVLIDLINQNINISPYFIAVLLWYPCFELLFSMIRKFKYKLSPMEPDINHLHQLLFKSLNLKFSFPINYNNSLTGLIINIYNLIILFLSSLKPFSTNFQIGLIFLNIATYLIAYLIFKKISRAN